VAVAKSALELKRFRAQQEELAQKIRLQVREAYQNVRVALRKWQAAKDQLKSNESAFKIVAKKYKEGMALQIEFINARNQFTTSKINTTIAQFDAMIKGAVLERVTASGPVQ
jgi:outer membrane protein TolC